MPLAITQAQESALYFAMSLYRSYRIYWAKPFLKKLSTGILLPNSTSTMLWTKSAESYFHQHLQCAEVDAYPAPSSRSYHCGTRFHKRKEHINALIPDLAANPVTLKSKSLPSCTD